MIVKNEAHIVHEVLEAVAPYIDCWVVVDTGSTDGTQDVIRSKMAGLGIPGELHERPWRDFGFNRSEALQLAQGKADYIWVMDADDTLEGTPDFQGLTADCYLMYVVRKVTSFWRHQLFRDGVPWRYDGVLHEIAVCDEPHSEANLEGDYRIVSRGLGARSLDPSTYRRDSEILLAEVQRNPDDARSVFYLAQSYEAAGDFANARIWRERHIQMDDWDQMIYQSMFKLAATMDKLGEPWAEVQDAYLRAWAYRPIRAEALNAIAVHYRRAEQYELGYLFAARAARIPRPASDTFFIQQIVYEWHAADEQAVCASWIGRAAEALRIWRRLLTLDSVPYEERARMLTNRDLMAGQRLVECATYPADLVRRPAGRVDAEVTARVIAGPDRAITEATLNSFLRCCTDLDRVGRFAIVDGGLSSTDRAVLAELYPFIEFASDTGQGGGRYVLELRQGWRFFTEEALVTRLIGVLEAEPQVSRVGVNLGDAVHMSFDSPACTGVRTTTTGGRYLLVDSASRGPVMIDTTRATGETATLDEVFCVYE
ncbi:MAG TPA: glycosyltransferase [Mycobacterium sp.]|nr:glycosyltransferase [Mycobacterium sp.]